MKTYTINGKKIKDVDYLKLNSTLYALLEALDEKKEECEYGWHIVGCKHEMTHKEREYFKKFYPDGTTKEEPKHTCVPECEENSHIASEPKSNLREEIRNKIFWNYQAPISTSEEIISLFKDTLLKEVQKAEPLRIPGESLEFTSGQEWTMRQIKQIIKNLL